MSLDGNRPVTKNDGIYKQNQTDKNTKKLFHVKSGIEFLHLELF